MEHGSEPGQSAERRRGLWSKWTRALTSEQAAKALVALGRIAELIRTAIWHCD